MSRLAMGMRLILGIFDAPHKRAFGLPKESSPMPELPEVEVTRRGLAPQLAGRKISGVSVREPRLRWPVTREVLALAGRTVGAIRRRRNLLLVGGDGDHLLPHVSLCSLRLVPPATPPGEHDHLH